MNETCYSLTRRWTKTKFEICIRKYRVAMFKFVLTLDMEKQIDKTR